MNTLSCGKQTRAALLLCAASVLSLSACADKAVDVPSTYRVAVFGGSVFLPVRYEVAQWGESRIVFASNPEVATQDALGKEEFHIGAITIGRMADIHAYYTHYPTGVSRVAECGDLIIERVPVGPTTASSNGKPIRVLGILVRSADTYMSIIDTDDNLWREILQEWCSP